MATKGAPSGIVFPDEQVVIVKVADRLILESREQRGEGYTPDRVILSKSDALRLADFIYKRWGRTPRQK